MRPKKSATGVPPFLDLLKDRDYALGYQVYQIGSCRRAHAWLGVVEEHGERFPACADRVQGLDDFVHEMQNLGFSVHDVPYFVMQRIRESGAKYKAADQGSDALLLRGYVLAR